MLYVSTVSPTFVESPEKSLQDGTIPFSNIVSGTAFVPYFVIYSSELLYIRTASISILVQLNHKKRVNECLLPP